MFFFQGANIDTISLCQEIIDKYRLVLILPFIENLLANNGIDQTFFQKYNVRVRVT